MERALRTQLAARLGELTGTRPDPDAARPVGGGCINQAHRFGDCFVKFNAAALADMFAAEADALAELEAGGVRVPRPIDHGVLAGQAYLALEYLPLQPLSGAAAATLGRQLAGLHRQPRSRFGWHRDNTIGATPQPNPPDGDWLSFWRDQRLGHQLKLAADNGHRGRLVERGERLLAVLGRLLAGHDPQPSLLHGDLWGGNAAMLADGTPVLFDPASYHGDREADLAMTELFGGFGPGFHASYREAWPVDDGYPLRRDLYNLYHVLNHLNLFGGGYRAQAERLIDRLLAAAG
ncbi:MAG: fructosamine kinase family protein [Candidatus Competibacterales bacterium]|nr:fructosamine kinase family protein [Candidatus Competibacterales bacterium]